MEIYVTVTLFFFPFFFNKTENPSPSGGVLAAHYCSSQEHFVLFLLKHCRVPTIDCSLSSPLATVSDSGEEIISPLARSYYIVLPEMTTVASGLYLLCSACK